MCAVPSGVREDALCFDTNGAHRGNRSELSRVGDVFLVEYSADRSDNFGGDVDAELGRGMPERETNPFERLVAAEKKWAMPRRRVSSWAESLPRVDRWL